jgi:hypothetical protein
MEQAIQTVTLLALILVLFPAQNMVRSRLLDFACRDRVSRGMTANRGETR